MNEEITTNTAGDKEIIQKLHTEIVNIIQSISNIGFKSKKAIAAGDYASKFLGDATSVLESYLLTEGGK